MKDDVNKIIHLWRLSDKETDLPSWIYSSLLNVKSPIVVGLFRFMFHTILFIRKK